MVLNKKIKRTISENKSQYFGSLILIAISCLLFTSFNIVMGNSLANLDEFRVKNVLEDASFIVQNKINNIGELETAYDLLLEERASLDCKINDTTTLRLLSSTDKIDKYAVVDGSRLERDDEILVDRSFAGTHGYKINDYIKIYGTALKIVGFATTPDYTYILKSEGDMLKNSQAFGIGIITLKELQQLKNGMLFYSVKFKRDNSNEFKNALLKNNAIIKWINKNDNNRISFIDHDMEGGVQIGKVLPISILILTCSLLSIVFWRLISMEYVQIGTLYALGYRKQEILRHYLSYALLLSALGSLIGTSAGIFCVNPLLKVITSYYNLPILIVDYTIKYIIISLVLPFLFLIPTTLVVSARALRLSPIDLIKGGRKKTKVGFIEKRLKLDKFKFNTKFKIRAIVRSISRTFLMIVGVITASMLLLLGFATKDSMDYLVQDSYTNIYTYNYDYIFNSFQTDNISAVDKLTFSPFNAKTSKSNFIIYGVPDDARYIKLQDMHNKPLSFENIIITKSLADKLSVKAGDEITVKNKLNSITFTIKIDKIAKAYVGDFIYMPIEEFNLLNGYPEMSYLEILSGKKLSISQDKLITVTDKNDLITGYKELLKPFKYMIAMITFVAVIIGLIIIYIVTSLIIEENRNNISLLKVLGYRKKEIFSLILNSNTILVMIGYIISVPLTLTSTNAFFKSMTSGMNMTIPVKINNINILIAFAIILITYEVSKLLNRRKITGISMADSLKLKAE